MNTPWDREPASSLRRWCRGWISGWNQFWFSPRDGWLLCWMRILVGAMLLYTHLVWSRELLTFFSDEGVLPEAYVRAAQGESGYAWSHFFWLSSPTWIWTAHFAALAVFLSFTIGLWTRVTGILSFLLVVSYANRATGALFGFDQMAAFLAMYLAIGPCGHALSLDRLIRRWRGGEMLSLVSIQANVVTRLIQVHLCVVYFFAGTGKLLGPAWWSGEAIYGTIASYEYQTLDLTWLVHYPWLIQAITLVTLFWEVSYAYLVWPRLTRPVFVGMAVLVHAGIGIAMGMLTFGMIMIIANMAFISPIWLRKVTGTSAAGTSGAGKGVSEKVASTGVEPARP